MEGLTQEESKFFESGGKTEVSEETETAAEVKEEPKTEEKTEVKQEVKEERKVPSKFEYSKDTDNVVDDLGRKYVPLGAVQHEREANKKLRAELDDLRS